MFNFGDKLDLAVNQMTVPDLWQQQAVSELRAGRDVVVHAPTGAGKTLVFELWSNQGKNHGQAIYTVPTRALANDKLAEWRHKGWNVGIATGDLSDNLDAPVIVATLETQKSRLIRGDGPALLVVDEYQMLGDTDRGLNYELAIALAPPRTQLLLLSGSVANPHAIVNWLRRLGRDAVLVRYDQRPVPLEEVMVDHLNYHLPSEIRGHWPRFIARALAENLGPVLLFAPRRQGAESIAAELARQLPNPNPLELSDAQKNLLPDDLIRMLQSRIAFHHSGLSYAVRAGIIEPLAKAGQLRVVVATMGLAAGINFSLRSVALAGDSYRRDGLEQPLRADEILQMFGRAGRRGIDETGYVLVSANGVRQHEGYPCQLSRSGLVDWSALLNLMHSAAENGQDPFESAVRVQSRLFTTKPIFLGVEEAMKHPTAPCGLRTDSERARSVRHRIKQFLNSAGVWEEARPVQEVRASDVRCPLTPKSVKPGAKTNPGKEAEHPDPSAGDVDTSTVGVANYRPLLSDNRALEDLGLGPVRMVPGSEGSLPVYARLQPIGDALHDGRVVMSRVVRRALEWNSRTVTGDVWEKQVVPAFAATSKTEGSAVLAVMRRGEQFHALMSLENAVVKARVDSHGVALWRAPVREVPCPECVDCAFARDCQQLPASTGVALLCRRLGLVDAFGKPTRRGRMMGFFSQADGLAIAAALEDETYPLDELAYDLANLDAGFRFAGDDNRWGGRLVAACQRAYGMQRIPGYLENGVPPGYGAGAAEVVAMLHKNPLQKHRLTNDILGAGDIDRALIEWRSLLRQIAHAPKLDWPRWTGLQSIAKSILNETASPTLGQLPPLAYNQTKRMDHRLILRR